MKTCFCTNAWSGVPIKFNNKILTLNTLIIKKNFKYFNHPSPLYIYIYIFFFFVL